MRVLFATFVLVAFVLSVGYAAAQHHMHQDHMDHGASVSDTREFVTFPPELVEHTIANMRDHLLALQQINEALAWGEHAAVLVLFALAERCPILCLAEGVAPASKGVRARRGDGSLR
jgi:ferric iron reductase protein FhuF